MRDIVQTARDRTSLRRRVRLNCQVVSEDAFSLLARECVDLSLRGMAVRAVIPAQIGTKLLVSFRAPGTSYVCDVEGSVARIAWGRRREDRSLTLGIAFTGLDPLTRAVLGARLQGVPPPIPQRRLRMDYAETVRAIMRDSACLPC